MDAEHTTRALTIGQAAARAGVAVDTMRFYERSGLLPCPQRTSGDHRRYHPAVVERLLFIRGAQRLGLRLAEIRGLLAARDGGTCPCGPAEDLLRQHRDGIDAEIARLSALREELTAMLDRIPGQELPPPLPGNWCPPVLADLQPGRR